MFLGSPSHGACVVLAWRLQVTVTCPKPCRLGLQILHLQWTFSSEKWTLVFTVVEFWHRENCSPSVFLCFALVFNISDCKQLWWGSITCGNSTFVKATALQFICFFLIGFYSKQVFCKYEWIISVPDLL